MKTLQKIIAGLLLLWGLPISIWAVVDTLNPRTAPVDKEGAVAALVLFGLPPVAVGGYFIHNLRQQHRATLQQGDRQLEQLFLAELQANGGIINPIVFATKAELSLNDTQAYLDQKAVQLNALYEATETGGIIYRFPV